MKKFIFSLVVSSAVLMASDFSSAMKSLDSGNNKVAFLQFQKLAKSGDVDAQTMLGEMYLDGIGVEQDNKKAHYWIEKAALAGDKEAQYLLGFMYENGIDVKENLKTAVSWYEKAANNGDVMAMYNLAFIYKNGGQGIKKNEKKAISLLKSVEREKDGV